MRRYVLAAWIADDSRAFKRKYNQRAARTAESPHKRHKVKGYRLKPEFSTEIICLKNADDIADFIGENPKLINHLVEHEGLPAWKRNGRGPWRALNVDLWKWLIGQRNKYLPLTPETIKREKENLPNAHLKNFVNS